MNANNMVIFADSFGEFVTGINWRRDGKAEIRSGRLAKAIRYTAEESAEVLDALRKANGDGYLAMTTAQAEEVESPKA